MQVDRKFSVSKCRNFVCSLFPASQFWFLTCTIYELFKISISSNGGRPEVWLVRYCPPTNSLGGTNYLLSVFSFLDYTGHRCAPVCEALPVTFPVKNSVSDQENERTEAGKPERTLLCQSFPIPLSAPHGFPWQPLPFCNMLSSPTRMWFLIIPGVTVPQHKMLS